MPFLFLKNNKKGGKATPKSERKKITDRAWNKKTYKQFNFQMRKDKDADIIAFLESQESKNATIKNALRAYMRAQEKEI